jgi:hypothetical protein
VTLKEARDSYGYSSGKLSDVVRQLSFAGIAVVWMFKTGTGGIPFDARLVWPLKFLVSSLALDLLHYAYAALAWGRFAHMREKDGVKDADEVFPDESINWISLVFFWSKAFLCVVAYVLLLICLWNRV